MSLTLIPGSLMRGEQYTYVQKYVLAGNEKFITMQYQVLILFLTMVWCFNRDRPLNRIIPLA